MSRPGQPIYECELAGGVALYDASELLARRGSGYRRRPWERIRRVYLHHSGASGAAGLLGALGTARYVVERRGWPGAAYHYWLPREPGGDAQGRLVVLRLQPDGVRSWHTGHLANTHGLGVCWQGDLNADRPTDAQHEMAEALIPWLAERHRLAHRRRWLSWHAEAWRYGGRRKASCPGPHVTAWAREWRGESVDA